MHDVICVNVFPRKLMKFPRMEKVNSVPTPLLTWPYTERQSAPQGNQCLILQFLASLGAQEQPDITLILHINVVIN